MSIQGPGALMRYAAAKQAVDHADPHRSVERRITWAQALLEAAEMADTLASTCRREAEYWLERRHLDHFDQLMAEADRHQRRADDYRRDAA